MSFLFSYFAYQLSISSNFIFLKNIKSVSMASYISSVCIIFTPKKTGLDLKSVVLALDSCVGCTIPHSVSYILKNPIVKSYLNDYFISSLNFKYSLL
jgi:hypothetical protein